MCSDWETNTVMNVRDPAVAAAAVEVRGRLCLTHLRPFWKVMYGRHRRTEELETRKEFASVCVCVCVCM